MTKKNMPKLNLEPMEKTFVEVDNQKSFDLLMQVLEASGFKWRGSTINGPVSPALPTEENEMCIHGNYSTAIHIGGNGNIAPKNTIAYSDTITANSKADQELSETEFYGVQGVSNDKIEEISDWFQNNKPGRDSKPDNRTLFKIRSTITSPDHNVLDGIMNEIYNGTRKGQNLRDSFVGEVNNLEKQVEQEENLSENLQVGNERLLRNYLRLTGVYAQMVNGHKREVFGFYDSENKATNYFKKATEELDKIYKNNLPLNGIGSIDFYRNELISLAIEGSHKRGMINYSTGDQKKLSMIIDPKC